MVVVYALSIARGAGPGAHALGGGAAALERGRGVVGVAHDVLRSYSPILQAIAVTVLAFGLFAFACLSTPRRHRTLQARDMTGTQLAL